MGVAIVFVWLSADPYNVASMLSLIGAATTQGYTSKISKGKNRPYFTLKLILLDNRTCGADGMHAHVSPGAGLQFAPGFVSFQQVFNYVQ